jgi:putative SOS response-associated peptidase YedK
MCGRYTSTSTVAELASVFEVDDIRADAIEPRYNVAPTLPVYAVAISKRGDKGPHRALGTFRWGLVPSWAKDPSVGSRMINARAETIAEKPAYRSAIERRRCLIPADAFYEWQSQPKGKLPYVIRRRDGQPMAFAGVWEIWRPAGCVPERSERDGEPLRSCAIVTTTANELMAPIHDRMPVILEREDWGTWLDPTTDMAAIEKLLRPALSELLEAYPVSSLVNKVDHEGPQLIEPLPAPPA